MHNKRRENQSLFEDSTTREEKEVNVSREREQHSLATEVGIVGMDLSIKGTGHVDNII